jgi:phage terminase large subunit GpA-like protein
LLDHVLDESYRSDIGRELRVRVTCVDTGGHHQHHVLTYCQQRRRRNIFPIKGIAGPRPIWPVRVSRTKDNSRIWMVGVDTAKDTLYGRLRIPDLGASYMHFPIGGAFDQEYFAQLTSEVVRTRYAQGRPYRVWILPPGKRNEALDTYAYALAARHAVRIPILSPRPEQKVPASSIADDDGVVSENEESEIGAPSVRRDVDANEVHQAYAEARRQQAGMRPSGWIYGGARPRGNWFNRG